MKCANCGEEVNMEMANQCEEKKKVQEEQIKYTPTNWFDYTIQSDGTLMIDKLLECAADEVVIQGEVNNRIVTVIGRSVFRGSRARSIKIPDSVNRIEKSAFSECNCEVIDIPCGVVNIDVETFRASVKLTSVTLPAGLKIINTEAFAYCYKLESVVLPEGVEYIGESAFTECRCLKRIVIPDSVEVIRKKAFACSMGSIAVFMTRKTADRLTKADYLRELGENCKIGYID